VRTAGPAATDKALELLEAVARAPGSSLTQLAEQCGIPFSTSHRLAQTLVARGFVVALGRGRYHLGPTALLLGARTSMNELLRELARPVLQQLARECRAHAHLAVYEGEMVTYLVKQRFGRVRMPSEEGAQLEAYCSSVGKVLLAHLDDVALQRYFANGALVALTPNTIVDEAGLRASLKTVRKQRWATDVGEIEPDVACLAVPVLGADDEVCAALSVSLRESPPDERRLLPFLAPLRAAADAIHARLSIKPGSNQRS
jgi:IclR family acetate operon transcriptional repressor